MVWRLVEGYDVLSGFDGCAIQVFEPRREQGSIRWRTDDQCISALHKCVEFDLGASLGLQEMGLNFPGVDELDLDGILLGRTHRRLCVDVRKVIRRVVRLGGFGRERGDLLLPVCDFLVQLGVGGFEDLVPFLEDLLIPGDDFRNEASPLSAERGAPSGTRR